MPRFGAFLMVLFLTPAALSAGSPLSKFGWFSDMVDFCWVGTFPDGKTQHTHCYTSQFDQFIRGTAILAADQNGQMTDRFFGDSVFRWDEKRERIVYYIWGSDGSLGKHEALYLGDELSFPIMDKKDPEKLAYRSVWRRIDRESFEVRREVPEGTGWRTELKVLYRKAQHK